MALSRRRFADDGWAVWITGDDTSTVYLNEWVMPKGKSYVDVGVRIRGIKATSIMNIYVPFSIVEEEIEDISLRLQDEEVVRAIFSATCLIDFKKNEHTSEVAYNARTIDIVHLHDDFCEVIPMAGNSLVVISLEKIQPYLDNDEAYFLFRLPHKSLDKMFVPRVSVKSGLDRLRDLLTSPVVLEKYGHSVRINEARLLPGEIHRIGHFHRQKLRKAVVTISIDEAYRLSDANCYRIRRVEEPLYKNYAPAGFDCSTAITYEWSESRKTNLKGHFNFYFDIAKEEVSQVSMMIYMILLLLIGAAGSAMYDLIKLGVQFLSGLG